MTDARLRELERRWKETLAPADEAAYVRERIRALGIDRALVEVAAHCGSQGAAESIGQPVMSSDGDTAAWLMAMRHWGRQVLVRGLWLMCTHAVKRVPVGDEGASALVAVNEWLRTGSEEALERSRAAGLAIAQRAIRTSERREAELALRDTATAVAARDPRAPAQGAIRHASAVLSEEEIRAVVSRGMISWALGV